MSKTNHVAPACLAALLLASAFGACTRVKPYQRVHLASEVMADPFSDFDAPYKNKVVQTRTGGGLAGSAVGGGCGCTQ